MLLLEAVFIMILYAKFRSNQRTINRNLDELEKIKKELKYYEEYSEYCDPLFLNKKQFDRAKAREKNGL
jgi:hypothetical protein